MRSWILVGLLLAALAVLGAGFWMLRPGSQPLPIHSYRIVDSDTIVIRTITGDRSETRVTNVTETPTSVTITVRSFDWYFGAQGPVYPIELTVDLEQPLGDRPVFGPDHSVPLEP